MSSNKRRDRDHHHAEYQPPIKANQETIDAVMAFQAKAASARKLANIIILIVFLASCAYGAFAWSEWGWWSIGFVIFTTLMAANICNPGGLMWRRDYLAIPGSSDHLGRHVCIYCGEHGVHRRGVYKSNIVHATCTSCGHHLWME